MNTNASGKGRALLAVICLAVAWMAVLAAPGAEPMRLEFGKKIPVDVQSHGVEWKGSTFNLVKLGSIEFTLAKESGALTAELKGGVTTFDQVEYEISVAVFDEAGELLGVGRVKCPVERMWLGKTMLEFRTFSVDLGKSLDYERAASFRVGINRVKVLTPEAWQK